MKEDDLINLMMEDTFAENDNVISISPLNSKRISYIECIKCFRLRIDGSVIDFPYNWSIFNLIKECYDGKSEYFFMEFDEDKDLDHLFSILSGHVSSKVIIYATKNDVKFIRVTDENEKAISTLKGELLKKALLNKNEKSNKSAA